MPNNIELAQITKKITVGEITAILLVKQGKENYTTYENFKTLEQARNYLEKQNLIKTDFKDNFYIEQWKHKDSKIESSYPF